MDIELDVSGRLGEPAALAGSYFAPDRPGPARAVLVCLPGGTYNRRYFDLEVPGHPDHSFARAATAEGFGVVAFDELGTGDSSRPDRDIGLPEQAAAAAGAVAGLPELLGVGGPWIGVGHSMGGYVVTLQQAADRSYAAIAVLGTTNQYVAPLGAVPELMEAAATPGGRDALVEGMLTAMEERYAWPDRAPMRPWFHLGDVPEAVVQADDATTLTVVPRRAGAQASVPGFVADAAAGVEVPVFLSYGEVDVSPDPHREVSYFRNSPDVTLFLLAGSGHCHNMAPTRRVLWRRLFEWCGGVVGATP